jgi:uncharacterized phage protein gp47/JayE
VAYSITTIETPVAGWADVKNMTDADVGRDRETNAAFRVRRELELVSQGKSPKEAIRAGISEVEDVEQVAVFVNFSNTADGDGLPAHSVEVVVKGGDGEDLALAVFANVAGGIEAHGDLTYQVTDSEYQIQTVKFSRPDDVLIYFDADITIDSSTFPNDGEDQIKAAIVAFGDASAFGKDAVPLACVAQIFSIPGVLDVTDYGIGIAPAPTGQTAIAIGPREIAVYDTSRITLATTPGTP